jgi:ADP-ribose pyrophosphatase
MDYKAWFREDQTGVTKMYEKTLSKKTIFQGRILALDVLEVELENGRHTTREIICHGGAVAILPRCPDGRFVFIQQFRKAMERICFEVVAGNCDPGESPEISAARELKEETGYTPKQLKSLGPIIPSVGYCTERIEVFLAEVGDSGATHFDEDESIETLLLSEEEMDAKIVRGEVADAKTLAAWMLYKLKEGRC